MQVRGAKEQMGKQKIQGTTRLATQKLDSLFLPNWNKLQQLMVSSKSSMCFFLCPSSNNKYRQTKLLCVTYETLTIPHFAVTSSLLLRYKAASFRVFSTISGNPLVSNFTVLTARFSRL